MCTFIYVQREIGREGIKPKKNTKQKEREETLITHSISSDRAYFNQLGISTGRKFAADEGLLYSKILSFWINTRTYSSSDSNTGCGLYFVYASSSSSKKALFSWHNRSHRGNGLPILLLCLSLSKESLDANKRVFQDFSFSI